MAKKISKGIEQRDEAMKAGASGATTLVFKGRLQFIDGYDVAESDPRASRVLMQDFELMDGDVLIIGCSPSPELAMDGAFAAAVLTLDRKN
jgi:hypothetical protein